MRWNKALIPTFKDDPSDAEVISHKLMVRAGIVKQLSAGLYTFLPLGWRAMLKAMKIIREEMNAIGGQEIFMPSLNPIEIWDETGRASDMGDILFRFDDRRGHTNILAPTHEEIVTHIARDEIRSFRDLPQIWFQIQNKFRDEPRARFGLLRVREFLMKDSYSLCATFEQLDKIYNLHEQAYRKIFSRCGIKYVVVGASSGLMGGRASQEFMVPSDAGEDSTAFCEKCGYAANTEVAESVPADGEWLEIDEKKKVHTPSLKTVEEVSEFLKIPKNQMLKSLVYVSENDEQPIMVLLRGDHQLNEEKLSQHIGGAVRAAHPEEVLDWFGAPVGFLGPIDAPSNIRILVDKAFPTDKNFATGANEQDFHIVGWRLEEIPDLEFGDFKLVQEGERCPKCGAPLSVRTTIEIGHIFKLGTKYSEAMGATFLDSKGEHKPIIMGSYGIGIGRILSSAIELFADKNGIVWPISIAPFEVIITALDVSKSDVIETAEKLYNELQANGIDVLYDDRDERAGTKFKDAELIGIPIRITVGRKVSEGEVEIFLRKDGSRKDVPIENAVETVIQLREKLYREIEAKIDS